ncbi:SDR family NAD(P)-dependent oxidoreductase [Halobacillus litoralis]|uniref:SDR family NAD(P)-dependent oxidoreductase n=1 Tax=Halobacillus litoralis TaxID=45668 RepID=A0A845E2F8_9BACI|nr:3-hydroxyacyl-CoA dehydrogenase [Halobacillus litoralis]MYL20467.1 SDR family NAD(P)-dependent oxidoreductase [Halobacillus litoralis]MYL36776.1 SDR family NAD(P)-dependent oxidoreductase [Halobacillus litoralis]
MNVSGASAFVTGGASGLGEAVVRKLIRQGGGVVIVDQNEEKGQALARELGSRSLFIQADVTSEAEVQQALKKGVETFGGIQAVINCAGIVTAEKVTGRDGPHSLESFQKVIQVNLIGTFNVIRLAAGVMQKNEAAEDGERGVMINTSSVAAFEGQIGQAAYSASKGGVAGMTLPVSRELARWGIRVMAIAPGLFETPMFDNLPEQVKEGLGQMTPFPKRLGRPYEFANLVVSIIENSMLNGEVIRLDGAIRMPAK